MADNSTNNQDPIGGLMGINDPSLLMNLGLGLMSAAKYSGNVGDGISGAIRNWQQQRLAGQQYQGGQLDLMRQKMLLGAALNEFGGRGLMAPQSSTASTGAAPANAPPLAPTGTGAAQTGAPSGFNAAQPAQSQPAPSAGAPSWLTPPSPNDIYNTPVGGISPGYLRGTALLSGRSPLPDLNSLREQQLKLAQQQYAPVIGRMDTLTKSDNPTAYMQADPEFKAAWPVLAQRLGFDPQKDLNDANVRTAFTFGRNNLASALSQATVAPPVQMRQEKGAYGEVDQVNPVDNSRTVLEHPAYPSYSLQKGQTIQGQEYVTPIQTGGFPGSGGARGTTAQARGGSAAASAPSVVPPGVSEVPRGATATGFTPPSNDQAKAAALANYARDNLGQMVNMEKSGYRMSPKARTILINAAMNDDPNVGSQLLSQEAMAHGLSDQDLSYAAAAFPVLQAAGHSMAGARLTPSQMRTNFESLLPVASSDKNYMGTVQKNRENLYRGLLGESGQAAYLPEYAGTLAADRQRISQGGSLDFSSPVKPAPLAAGQSRVVNGVKITRLGAPANRGASGNF
jgi:hypothetical protein